MKTIYFLTTFVLFHCFNLLGQVPATEVVVSELDSPEGMAIKENILYVTDEGEKILKIDMTTETPVASTLVEGLSGDIRGLAIHENDLYVAHFSTNRVSKINLTSETAIATEVVSGLSGPSRLAIHGNELYVSESSSGKISKINLTSETATATEVVSGLSEPYGLAIHENELYVSESLGKISKINLTSETATVTEFEGDIGQFGYIGDLVFHGNEVYIFSLESEETSPTDQRDLDGIFKIDVTDPTATTTQVLKAGTDSIEGDVYDTRQMLIDNNILYMTDAYSGEVLKFNLGTLSASTPELEATKLQISPIPAMDFLQVSGLKAAEKYAIYNVLGAKIQEGTLNDEKQIDLKKVPKGICLLRFENMKTIKFVKE